MDRGVYAPMRACLYIVVSGAVAAMATACGGSSSGGTRLTTAQACTQLQSAADAMQDSLNAANTETAAGKAFADSATSFSTIGASAENTSIKSAAAEAAGTLRTFSQDIATGITPSRAEIGQKLLETQGAVKASCPSFSLLTRATPSGGTHPTTPTRSKAGTPAITTSAGADTLGNLRELATAEEIYFTGYDRYTANSTLLEGGFTSGPGLATETLLAGVNPKKGYCLIGGVSLNGPWFLYDSHVRGGFLSRTFGQQSSAEAACSDKSIARYQALALA